ncbi:copper chaperone PCu(A)C [Streptomyces sp. NPDC058279]|uniref:copper chaperone PCu(A)C n=1 Tax=Streptomyces sp. NPDC058279 TaxID=3346418 RepID=UPI0036E244F7
MNARTTRSLAATLSLTAVLAISGCSSESGGAPDSAKPTLTVSGAFMPEPVDDKMAGAFMIVTNDSKTPDKLTGLTSPLSDDLQIHESKDQKMRQVSSLNVPANGRLSLERGGSHVMFMGLKSKPKVGDKVKVELKFEKADPITIELDVKDRTYTGQSSSAH